MLITILCPVCDRKSQIDDANRGKRLRCPYPDCRKPFLTLEDGRTIAVVDQELESAERPTLDQLAMLDDRRRKKSTPIPAVQTHERRTPEEPEPVAMDWRSAPPPVRDWRTEPPPLRRPTEPSATGRRDSLDDDRRPAARPAIEADENPYRSYRPRSRRGLRIGILLFILIGVAGSAVGGFVLWQRTQWAEQALAQKAQEEYSAERYDRAERAFNDLIEKYPASDQLGHYRFMAQWSRIQGIARSPSPDVPHAAGLLDEFVRTYDGDSSLVENLKDVERTAFDLASHGAEQSSAKGDRRILDAGRSAWKLARLLAGDNPDAADRLDDLERRLIAAERAVVIAEAKAKLLGQFAKIEDEKAPGGVESAQQLFAVAAKSHPSLAEDDDLRGKLASLRASEPSWVQYRPASRGDTPAFKPDTESESSIWLCPSRMRSAVVTRPDGCVLAVSRGVLYGLSARDGTLCWARRIGVDSPAHPVMLDWEEGKPPAAIVVASAEKRLLILDSSTGKTLWAFPLPGRCPGPPVLHGPRLFLPLADGRQFDQGRVFEIELDVGGTEHELKGVYDLGQPPAGSCTLDRSSRRLYVPAEKKRIYILNVEKNQCDGVIYTDHLPGELLGPPVAAAGTLIVADAIGLDRMRVRAYDVAGTPSDTTSAEFTLPGWAEFPPYFDGRTLGYATDRGLLALFAFEPQGRKRLTPLTAPLTLAGAEPEADGSRFLRCGQFRPLILRAEPLTDGSWWLLWNGRIHRYRFDVYREELVPVSVEPARLGAPLSDRGWSRDEQYYLTTTEPAGGGASLATYVHAATGTAAWQTQLGLHWAADPVVLGRHLLLFDRSGGVVALERAADSPETPAPKAPGAPAAEADWLVRGRDDVTGIRTYIGPDGSYVLQIVFTKTTDQIILRKITSGKLSVVEKLHRLPSPPAGTPALTSRAAIFPCADGRLYEFPFDEQPATATGLTWRDAPRAGETAPGFAVAIGDEQLIVSDGANRLQRWDWNREQKQWEKTRVEAVDLPGRISAPLVLLAGPEQKPILWIVDDSGTALVVSADTLKTAPGAKPEKLNGTATLGPFRAGKYAGVVVGSRQFIWFEASVRRPTLRTHTSARLELVGQPQRSGNRWLVTEADGTLAWLNPETGEKVNTATVPAAPAAAAQGGKMVWVPLLDGSIQQVPEPK